MGDDLLDRDALIALLDFHVAAGVDLALDETPHDRFAEPDSEWAPRPVPTARAPELTHPPRPVVAAPSRLPAARSFPIAAPAPPDEIAAGARRMARDARDLAELEAIVAAFDGCSLKASAKRLAFSDGVPGSAIMLVGEAPGAEEDRTGKPFVGRAGQLLDRMLAAIGLDRNAVYIANVVPWRPPGNRTPTPQEVAICLPFIERQIELAAPKLLVTLGAPATQTLARTKEGIFKTRGRWAEYAGETFRVRALPMLHPAYLLRQPLHKRLAWRDLRLLRRTLDEMDSPEQKADKQI